MGPFKYSGKCKEILNSFSLLLLYIQYSMQKKKRLLRNYMHFDMYLFEHLCHYFFQDIISIMLQTEISLVLPAEETYKNKIYSVFKEHKSLLLLK